MKSLQVENLSVQLQNVVILQNISFTLDVGGVSVLLGRSGAGKTTLLRAINRLNECEAKCVTSGEIYLHFDGQDLPIYAATSYGKNTPLGSIDALRRRVGMVFQTPHILPLSIEQNILFPLQFHGMLSKESSQKQLEDILRMVKLWDDVHWRLQSPATELSGGQQQRLCLARTLALEPDYLLLDEPTASLDMITTKSIEEVIKKVAKTTHCIMVCHSVEQALRLGNRFILLNPQGEIVIKEKLSEEDICNCFDVGSFHA